MPRRSGEQIVPMPSPRNSRFARAPQAQIPRSQFDRSYGHKTTFDAGYLVPVYVDEVLPGDTFNLKMNGFARLATPIKPIMDNLHLETFFFFVPYRLVWDNWQKFNGEQDNPGDSTDFTIPRQNTTIIGEGSLGDYFGIPIGLDTSVHNVSTLPFRAYGLIWNEWFRDENLQDSIGVATDNGPDNLADAPRAVLRRGKRHDYFTSALPWPQKGDSVTIPLGETARIQGIGAQSFTVQTGPQSVDETGPVSTDYDRFLNFNSGELLAKVNDSGTPELEIYADLTTATAASINELRQAFQIQKLLERDARGGTRYTEILRSHFGVTSPDQRLQRPEYLGGGYSPVVINPIAQTTSTDATTPQGNLAAVGTSSFRGHGFTKSFVEHGIVIGLVSVRADLTYQQGLHRMWSRETRYDFYWPALAHIGEQAVLSKEIYVDNTADDEDVFGYQERYAEYRYHPSRITGEFRSDATASLDIWHLAQDFGTRPVLNASFIEEDPPVDRVIAVPSEPHFLFDSFFHLKCARPMPVYGVPGLIDHF